MNEKPHACSLLNVFILFARINRAISCATRKSLLCNEYIVGTTNNNEIKALFVPLHRSHCMEACVCARESCAKAYLFSACVTYNVIFHFIFLIYNGADYRDEHNAYDTEKKYK